jgi:hypothetical protein
MMQIECSGEPFWEALIGSQRGRIAHATTGTVAEVFHVPDLIEAFLHAGPLATNSDLAPFAAWFLAGPDPLERLVHDLAGAVPDVTLAR